MADLMSGLAILVMLDISRKLAGLDTGESGEEIRVSITRPAVVGRQRITTRGLIRPAVGPGSHDFVLTVVRAVDRGYRGGRTRTMYVWRDPRWAAGTAPDEQTPVTPNLRQHQLFRSRSPIAMPMIRRLGGAGRVEASVRTGCTRLPRWREISQCVEDAGDVVGVDVLRAGIFFNFAVAVRLGRNPQWAAEHTPRRLPPGRRHSTAQRHGVGQLGG